LRVSIIIPVYNEAATVGAVIDKVRELDLDKEIIVVDDGSRDGTRQALARFTGVAGVRVHHSPVNLGKGASLRIGFSLATGEVVTVQDADLELDPAELKRLCQPIFAGEADVVYGSRFLGAGLVGGKKGGWTFYLANRALSGLASVLYRARLTDIETCYKVFRKEVLDALTLRASRFEIEPEVTAQVLKHGYRILELPIGYNPRTKAQGKKISWKDGFAAVAMLVTQRMED
jgi:glycosyltransferase involved in cell wall biosynthesis